MPLKKKKLKQIAGLELNAFNFARILPDALEGGAVKTGGTPIYDINGDLLYRRFPIKQGKSALGYSDIAANEVMGALLIGVSIGAEWNEREILKEAAAAADRVRGSVKYDKMRFVAYSYPKIAVQFLRKGKEVLMLEWKTWAEVLPLQEIGRKKLEPSNFERWSFIDEMPEETRRANTRSFNERLDVWDESDLRKLDATSINRELFELESDIIVIKLFDTRELHYSTRSADHYTCYELRGQQTNVWCVAASVEMLLNFYRYHYNQIRLADELGLGTCATPNGLPYSQVGKVVTVIEDLSSNTLNATMHTNPGFNIFRNEIRANRPLISFIPGHSRTVAGYTNTLIHIPGELPFRGLLVYDPWPPTDCDHPEAGGVITRWENFHTHTYQYAYSAVLQHV